MKNLVVICLMILMFCLLGCEKEIAPTVVGLEVEETSPYTIVVSAVISSEGSCRVETTGFCVNYPSNPQAPTCDKCDTIISKRHDNNWVFHDTIKGLTPGGMYKICAFAKNKVGTGLSEPIYVQTLD